MSFGIMLHSGLCHIRDYVAFGGPVVRAYSMSFGILSDVGVSCIGSLIICCGRFEHRKRSLADNVLVCLGHAPVKCVRLQFILIRR